MPVKRTSAQRKYLAWHRAMEKLESRPIARPKMMCDDASIAPLLAEADLYMRDVIIDNGRLERIGEWFLDAAYQTVEGHRLQQEWFGKECP